jgi:hypothetical protein
MPRGWQPEFAGGPLIQAAIRLSSKALAFTSSLSFLSRIATESILRKVE